MPFWQRRRLPAQTPRAPEAAPGEPGLWEIVPPEGVTLVESRPSRTGQGGQGVLATYSDGVTASAMVNSDGSVRVLLFRGTASVPALLQEGEPVRFTWAPAEQSPDSEPETRN